MTSTPMRSGPPIQRAIEAAITRSDTGEKLTGTLYANDFSDGAVIHQLAGYLTDSQGDSWKFLGELGGVQFVPKETRGAPKKTARNVALFLACEWLRSQEAEGSNVSHAAVLEKLRELWAALTLDLTFEDKTLREQVSAGKDAVKGASLLSHFNPAHLTAGAVIAAEWREFNRHGDGGFSVKGEGWRWQYGMEHATHGALVLNVRVSQGEK